MFNKNLSSKSICLCALILVIFSLASFSATVSSSGSSTSKSSSQLGTRRLESEEKVSARSLPSDVENEDESGQDEETDMSKEFTWDMHPEDHGIYANRELMSAENVKSPEDIQDQEGDPDTQKYFKGRVVKFDDYEALKTKDFAEKEWQLMFRSIDLIFDNVLNSLKPPSTSDGKPQLSFFEEIISRLKPECKRDIAHVTQSVKKHKLWAMRMLDSNGKLPSGITYGRFSSPGDYEECLGVSVDDTVYREGDKDHAATSTNLVKEYYKFRGKYCLLDFRLPLPERPKDKLLSIHDPVLDLGKTEMATMFPSIKNYSGYASMFYEVGYMHGLCLPSSCDIKDLTKSMAKTLEGLYIIVNNTIDCEERSDESEPLTGSQWISSSLLVILFVNAFAATVIHHLLAENKKRRAKAARRHSSDSSEGDQKKMTHNSKKSWLDNPQYNMYSNCFSIQTNFERLTKPDPRGLTFVHYTRIVAMALTVITHTAAMGTLQAITKPADASNNEQIFRDFLPQMLANAFSSIQIFFFMAGFMLVISTYPSIKRERGHISFIEYAIKRAIRLMPGLAATIAVNFLWPLFSEGPMITYFKRMIVKPCETNWWRTLGFLSNFDHVEKMCIRHSYFSASDYQLHLMAFPLLILLHKQPILSLCIAGILTAVGFTAQVIVILTKTVLPFMMVDYIDKEAFFNVVHYIHHPVWNHMSAFFYGFIIGYIVVKQIRVNMSPKTIQRVWMIVVPLGFASIFAPYFWNHYKRPIFKWQMVLYVLIDRSILLTTCAWLAYASMVLSRKPPEKPTETSAKQTNLPEIVTLDSAKPEKDNSESKNIDPSSNQLTASVGSMKRQRSSPNFLSSRADEGNNLTTTLRPAASTADLSSKKSSESDGKQELPFTVSGDQPAAEPAAQQQRAKRQSAAPVSNVNILCLVLSRLTFQLYLFNMVVLWIDVTNSKYYWYFSYYFIITKAFAVYIASTIMATIFFVTLESPCLTLYITWVKSRAQSRAKRMDTRGQANDDLTNGRRVEQCSSFETNNLNATIDSTQNQETDCLARSPESGLHMRAINSQSDDKPTFSFIDLSTPPSTDVNSTAEQTISDQTRM